MDKVDELRREILAKLDGQVDIAGDELDIVLGEVWEQNSITWHGKALKPPFHRGMRVCDQYNQSNRTADETSFNIRWIVEHHELAVEILRKAIDYAGRMISDAGGTAGPVLPTDIRSVIIGTETAVSLGFEVDATLLNNALERKQAGYKIRVHDDGRASIGWTLEAELRQQKLRREQAGRAIKIDRVTWRALVGMTAKNRRDLLEAMLAEARTMTGTNQNTSVPKEWRKSFHIPDVVEMIGIINGRIKAKVRLGEGVIWNGGVVKITRKLPETITAGMGSQTGRVLRDVIAHPDLADDITITKVHLTPRGMVVMTTDVAWSEFNPEQEK